MTHYTQFQKQILKLIKEVFGVSSISMDTKLIVLVLAATLTRSKFKEWVLSVPRLQPFAAQFQQINALRHHFGTDCRNFIMLIVLRTARYAITDTELQQFIAQK